MARNVSKFILKSKMNVRSKNYKMLNKSKKDLKLIIDMFQEVLQSYTTFILAVALEAYEPNADIERINRKLEEEYSHFIWFFMKNDPNFHFLNKFKPVVLINILKAAEKGKMFWKDELFSNKSLFAEVQKNINDLLKRNLDSEANYEELCLVTKDVVEIQDEVNELKTDLANEWKEKSKILSERRKASLAKKFTKKLLKSLKHNVVDENEYKNEKCPICLDSFVQPIRVTCDHVFCKKCVNKSLLHMKLCPLCKADLV